ncbi:hypothetical protein BN2476_240081 [Paraburkholderia piptadeniae]|uniref:Uncharacterized protein n=1 Tax=Paraburkholderia piptadeniae TaxID=1701573 RepID=A0A1N7RYZ6_9BURK|nr:hypothetical protein BN2476_240081 [Paraburkholderia piptadeniae]
MTRTPVLQISATVHIALVQGIYDLGEPGREAEKRLLYNIGLIADQSSPSRFIYCTLYC